MVGMDGRFGMIGRVGREFRLGRIGRDGEVDRVGGLGRVGRLEGLVEFSVVIVCQSSLIADPRQYYCEHGYW